MAAASVGKKLSERLRQLCGVSNYGPCLSTCNTDLARRPYETDDGVFLYVVRVEYPSLWDMCYEPGTLLIVPQGISLPADITLDDVQTHMLKETKMPGEYNTVNGKRVFIDGNELCTRDGFVEERRVRILMSEEIGGQYDGGEAQAQAQGQGGGTTTTTPPPPPPPRVIRALHVSRPLEGGVPAPDDPDELDYDSMRKYVAILRCNPEVEGIFKDMDAFIDEVNFLGQYSTDGFTRLTPSLESCVLAQWQWSVEVLVEQSGLLQVYLGPSHVKDRHKVQMAQIVESYIMGSIHRTVYPWTQQRYATKDHRLSQVLHAMRCYSQSDVGIAPEFHCCVNEAVKELVRINDCRTPLEKLLCLKATALCLFRLVQSNLRHSFTSVGDFQLATDDLVQLMVYTIIKAYPHSSSLVHDLRYINQFHFVSVSTSATGYYLNNFEVAVDYLLSKLGASCMEGDSCDDSNDSKQQREEGDPDDGHGDGGSEEEVVQRLLEQLPPPLTDLALLDNVRDVLEERGCLHLLASSSTLPPPPSSSSTTTAKDQAKIKRAGYESDEDYEGEEKKGPSSSPPPLAPPSSSSSTSGGSGGASGELKSQTTVMIFGEAGVRVGGDQAQTQVVIHCSSSTSSYHHHQEGEEEGSGSGGGLELEPVPVKQATCGQQYFAVVTQAGELQTWGLAEGGRLGHGQDFDVFFPTPRPETVTALSSEVIAMVSCGAYHMLAVTEGGDLFSWGDNRCGQVGHGRRLSASGGRETTAGGGGGSLVSSLSGGGGGSSSGSGSSNSIQYSPRRVDFFAGQRMVAVAAGNLHSLALSREGQVYSWGRAQSGRLGRLPEVDCMRDEFAPGLIEFNWNTKEVISSQYTGVVSDSDQPHRDNTIVKQAHRSKVVSLAAGWSHSLAVTSDGRVFSWGAGAEGRLGHGTYADEYYPKQIRALSSPFIKVVQVAGGYGHSLFLTDHGEVFGSGYNKFGQVGLDLGIKYPEVGGNGRAKVSAELIPRRVKSLVGVKVVSVSTGENHSAARSEDSRVFTWGLNLANQCAQGRAIEQQGKPREVAILRGAKQVACGASHTVVVM